MFSFAWLYAYAYVLVKTSLISLIATVIYHNPAHFVIMRKPNPLEAFIISVGDYGDLEPREPTQLFYPVTIRGGYREYFLMPMTRKVGRGRGRGGVGGVRRELVSRTLPSRMVFCTRVYPYAYVASVLICLALCLCLRPSENQPYQFNRHSNLS